MDSTDTAILILLNYSPSVPKKWGGEPKRMTLWNLKLMMHWLGSLAINLENKQSPAGFTGAVQLGLGKSLWPIWIVVLGISVDTTVENCEEISF